MAEDWFVGRSEQLDLLKGLVARVAAGVGGSILLTGEQGIGKTALLRRALQGVPSRCQVAWATAEELEQELPLGLMADCFGRAGRLVAAGQQVGPDPGDGGGRSVLAGDPVLAGVERMLALADRLCAASPLVVVAEDLQWADEASVLVWHQLSRAARQAPLLVVGSLRPGSGRDDLARLQRGVTARGGLVMTLGPLATLEVTELMSQVVGGRLGRPLAGLAERAGGNPLYARELADALVRGGQVRVTAGVAELTSPAADVTAPVSLAGVIGARLASLSEDAARALRWAAVLGQEFSVVDLEMVTGLDIGNLILVLQEAVAAGVAAEAGSRMCFRHGLIRDAVYQGMPASLRSALHLQAARALARAGAAPERVAAQLLAAPGATDGWARGWLAEAAPILAYRAPRVTYDLLCGVLRSVAEGDPLRDLFETVLVRVAFLLLNDAEVERVGRQLLARTRDPDRAAEVAWLVAYTVMRAGQPADAALMVERAVARPGMSTAHTARLNALYAMTLTGTGRVDEGMKVADQALAGAQVTGDRFAAGYALQAMMWPVYHARDFAGVIDRIDEALDVIGDDPQTIDLHLLLLMNRFAILDAIDRRAEALATAQQALALGERVGTSRLDEIRSFLAAVYFDAGLWDDALDQLEAAVAASGSEIHKVMARALAALIAGHRDDSAVADEHLAAIEGIPVSEIAWAKPVTEVFLARALAAERAGRTDEAEAVLLPYLDPILATSAGDMNEAVLPMLTRLAVTAGHDDVAARAYAAAQSKETETTAEHCRALIESDPDALMAVAKTYPPTAMPLPHAQALEDAAVAFASRSDFPAARAALHEAAKLYEALDASWDMRRAVARLRPYGISRDIRSRRPLAFGWDALTPAERTIAYMVADGRSNPDIAAELFLSRNTVQTHVSRILTKLRAQSRTDIAREVLARPGPAYPARTGSR
jgi:DNA-binding NarL/FixJ family response regulator